MTLTLRYAAHSDRGLIRDGNQDSVFAGPRLLAVADGMGGMAAGDVASNIVIATLAPLDEDVPGADLIDALRGGIVAANQRLRDTVEANPQMEGMGTTLTGMLFSGSRFGLAHVGDSRAYLLRDGELAQITKDDSYVQMLVDEGRITQDEAATHPQRSLLTRALDGRDVEPAFSVREAHTGDRYLLCSDGLHGFVSVETITETLLTTPDREQCVDRLIQLALRAGGPDNVTVIVADVIEGDIVEQQPIVGGAAALDRGMATTADPSSPAARAAATQQTSQPEPPEAPAEDEPAPAEARKRHPVRNTLVVLGVLAILGGGAFGGWYYTQTQYYVGATEDNHVAVFRGVPGKVVGLRLSEAVTTSPTKLDELTKVARNKVQEGIPASSREAAVRTMSEITDDSPSNTNMLPVCPKPKSTTNPPGSTVPGNSASPTPALPSGRPSTSGSPGTVPGTSASPSSPVTDQDPGCRPGK